MDTTTQHACKYSTAREANARIRRSTLATVLYLASLTGHSDGTSYAVCVGCGENAYVGGSPRAMDTFNLGHVQADAQGGMYCPCNMLPLCRQCNADMADETLTDVLVPVYDNRSEWDGVFVPDAGTVKEADSANRGRASWKVPASL